MTRKSITYLGSSRVLRLRILAVGYLGAILGCNTTPAPPSETVSDASARSVLTLPPTQHLAAGAASPAVTLSPDGARVVVVVRAGDSEQLALSSLDEGEPTLIAGTEGAANPFFSPDGQWVGFFADGKLKKVSLNDGTVVTLCDAARQRGASWGADDTIVFTPALNSGLWQVPASGGTPQVLTTLQEERSHRWPDVLPDGKGVLFSIPTGRTWDDAEILVQQIETGERRVLVEGGTFARYVPTGHLVYARGGRLMAVPFDLSRLQVSGTAVPVVEGLVENTTSGAAQFSFSGSGALVYIPGGMEEPDRTLVWVDRQGAAQPLPLPPRAYEHPRLSPDGQRLAVGIAGKDVNIFVYDIKSDKLTQVTSGDRNTFPVWTPDGKRLAFRSTKAGPWNVFWKSADGSGTAERLTSSEYAHEPSSWSPDGQVLAFTENHRTTSRDIWALPLGGESQPRPIVRTPSDEGGARFSPDGRWMVYASDESGQNEIYAQPFPGPGERRRISSDGGTEPVWARNGRELFYRKGDKMMAVDITTEPSFRAGNPRLLFEERYVSGIASRPNYDVSPDGQRFLMLRESEPPPQLNVVRSWFEDLKRKVPVTSDE